jgi:hypothetical protein
MMGSMRCSVFGKKVITLTPARSVMSFRGSGYFGWSGFSGSGVAAFAPKLSGLLARGSTECTFIASFWMHVFRIEKTARAKSVYRPSTD